MAKENKNPQTVAPSQRLINTITEILGFDPTQSPRPTKSAFANALEKISEERQQKAEEQAEALAREAIKAAELFGQQQRQWKATEEKFVKEFQKTMNKIKGLAEGKNLEEIEAEEKEKEDKEEASE